MNENIIAKSPACPFYLARRIFDGGQNVNRQARLCQPFTGGKGARQRLEG
ncbi:MAG: hypothetical protein PHS96_00180 [Anaerolineales bacterium]|nr:hypothetical protein [Anaerolineales bacterium]